MAISGPRELPVALTSLRSHLCSHSSRIRGALRPLLIHEDTVSALDQISQHHRHICLEFTLPKRGFAPWNFFIF